MESLLSTTNHGVGIVSAPTGAGGETQATVYSSMRYRMSIGSSVMSAIAESDAYHEDSASVSVDSRHHSADTSRANSRHQSMDSTSMLGASGKEPRPSCHPDETLLAAAYYENKLHQRGGGGAGTGHCCAKCSRELGNDAPSVTGRVSFFSAGRLPGEVLDPLLRDASSHGGSGGGFSRHTPQETIDGQPPAEDLDLRNEDGLDFGGWYSLARQTSEGSHLSYPASAPGPGGASNTLVPSGGGGRKPRTSSSRLAPSSLHSTVWLMGAVGPALEATAALADALRMRAAVVAHGLLGIQSALQQQPAATASGGGGALAPRLTGSPSRRHRTRGGDGGSPANPQSYPPHTYQHAVFAHALGAASPHGRPGGGGSGYTGRHVHSLLIHPQTLHMSLSAAAAAAAAAAGGATSLQTTEGHDVISRQAAGAGVAAPPPEEGRGVGFGGAVIRSQPVPAHGMGLKRFVAASASWAQVLLLTATGDVYQWRVGSQEPLSDHPGGGPAAYARAGPGAAAGATAAPSSLLPGSGRPNFLTPEKPQPDPSSRHFYPSPFQQPADASPVTMGPLLVQSLAWERALRGIRIMAVACGPQHCLALSSPPHCALFSWGCGADGRLGHGGDRDEPVPRVVTALLPFRVTSVAAGSSHSAAITAGGIEMLDVEEYLRRVGRRDGRRAAAAAAAAAIGGQRAGEADESEPGGRVDGSRPSAAAQGSSTAPPAPGTFGDPGPHVASLQWCKTDDDYNPGALWTWGRGKHGALGHGSEADCTEPKRVRGVVRVAHRVLGPNGHVLEVGGGGPAPGSQSRAFLVHGPSSRIRASPPPDSASSSSAVGTAGLSDEGGGGYGKGELGAFPHGEGEGAQNQPQHRSLIPAASAPELLPSQQQQPRRLVRSDSSGSSNSLHHPPPASGAPPPRARHQPQAPAPHPSSGARGVGARGQAGGPTSAAATAAARQRSSRDIMEDARTGALLPLDPVLPPGSSASSAGPVLLSSAARRSGSTGGAGQPELPPSAPRKRERAVCVQVACGASFTVAVTADGDVWAFGRSDKGQCGVDLGRLAAAQTQAAAAAAGASSSAAGAGAPSSGAGKTHSKTDASAPAPSDVLYPVRVIFPAPRHVHSRATVRRNTAAVLLQLEPAARGAMCPWPIAECDDDIVVGGGEEGGGGFRGGAPEAGQRQGVGGSRRTSGFGAGVSATPLEPRSDATAAAAVSGAAPIRGPLLRTDSGGSRLSVSSLGSNNNLAAPATSADGSSPITLLYDADSELEAILSSGGAGTEGGYGRHTADEEFGGEQGERGGRRAHRASGTGTHPLAVRPPTSASSGGRDSVASSIVSLPQQQREEGGPQDSAPLPHRPGFPRRLPRSQRPGHQLQPPPTAPARWVPAMSLVTWATGAQALPLSSDSETLQQEADAARVVRVSAGVSHVVACTRDGGVWSWGANGFRQVGVSRDAAVYTPEQVPVQLFMEAGTMGQASDDHAAAFIQAADKERARAGFPCATRTAPHACEGGWCRGCGRSRPAHNLTLAGSAPAEDPVVSVFAGAFHTVVGTAGGAMLSWGRNAEGELGLGDCEEHRGPEVTAVRVRVTAVQQQHTRPVGAPPRPGPPAYNILSTPVPKPTAAMMMMQSGGTSPGAPSPFADYTGAPLPSPEAELAAHAAAPGMSAAADDASSLAPSIGPLVTAGAGEGAWEARGTSVVIRVGRPWRRVLDVAAGKNFTLVLEANLPPLIRHRAPPQPLWKSRQRGASAEEAPLRPRGATLGHGSARQRPRVADSPRPPSGAGATRTAADNTHDGAKSTAGKGEDTGDGEIKSPALQPPPLLAAASEEAEGDPAPGKKKHVRDSLFRGSSASNSSSPSLPLLPSSQSTATLLMSSSAASGDSSTDAGDCPQPTVHLHNSGASTSAEEVSGSRADWDFGTDKASAMSRATASSPVHRNGPAVSAAVGSAPVPRVPDDAGAPGDGAGGPSSSAVGDLGGQYPTPDAAALVKDDPPSAAADAVDDYSAPERLRSPFLPPMPRADAWFGGNAAVPRMEWAVVSPAPLAEAAAPGGGRNTTGTRYEDEMLERLLQEEGEGSPPLLGDGVPGGALNGTPRSAAPPGAAATIAGATGGAPGTLPQRPPSHGVGPEGQQLAAPASGSGDSGRRFSSATSSMFGGETAHSSVASPLASNAPTPRTALTDPGALGLSRLFDVMMTAVRGSASPAAVAHRHAAGLLEDDPPPAAASVVQPYPLPSSLGEPGRGSRASSITSVNQAPTSLLSSSVVSSGGSISQRTAAATAREAAKTAAAASGAAAAESTRARGLGGATAPSGAPDAASGGAGAAGRPPLRAQGGGAPAAAGGGAAGSAPLPGASGHHPAQQQQQQQHQPAMRSGLAISLGIRQAPQPQPAGASRQRGGPGGTAPPLPLPSGPPLPPDPVLIRVRDAAVVRAQRRVASAIESASLVNAWEAVLDNLTGSWDAFVMGDLDLRRLWRAGVPAQLRSRVWPLAIGNAARVTPAQFEMFRQRAAMASKQQAAAAAAQSAHALALQQHQVALRAAASAAAAAAVAVGHHHGPRAYHNGSPSGHPAHPPPHGPAPHLQHPISSLTSALDTEPTSPNLELFLHGEAAAAGSRRQPHLHHPQLQHTNRHHRSFDGGPGAPAARPAAPAAALRPTAPPAASAPRLLLPLVGREDSVRLIPTDLPRTFPTLQLFGPPGSPSEGPLYRHLRDVLEAFVAARPEIGYVQGMSYLAAMLCLYTAGTTVVAAAQRHAMAPASPQRPLQQQPSSRRLLGSSGGAGSGTAGGASAPGTSPGGTGGVPSAYMREATAPTAGEAPGGTETGPAGLLFQSPATAAGGRTPTSAGGGGGPFTSASPSSAPPLRYRVTPPAPSQQQSSFSSSLAPQPQADGAVATPKGPFLSPFARAAAAASAGPPPGSSSQPQPVGVAGGAALLSPHGAGGSGGGAAGGSGTRGGGGSFSGLRDGAVAAPGTGGTPRGNSLGGSGLGPGRGAPYSFSPSALALSPLTSALLQHRPMRLFLLPPAPASLVAQETAAGPVRSGGSGAAPIAAVVQRGSARLAPSGDAGTAGLAATAANSSSSSSAAAATGAGAQPGAAAVAPAGGGGRQFLSWLRFGSGPSLTASSTQQQQQQAAPPADSDSTPTSAGGGGDSPSDSPDHAASAAGAGATPRVATAPSVQQQQLQARLVAAAASAAAGGTSSGGTTPTAAPPVAAPGGGSQRGRGGSNSIVGPLEGEGADASAPPAPPTLLLTVADDRFVTFQALVNLMSRHHLYVFYAMDPGPLAPYYDLFDRLLYSRNPALAAHLADSGVLTEMYLFGWLQTVFLKCLPLAAASRVWDLFLLEGTPALYRVGAALLDLLSPHLLGSDRRAAAQPDETIQLLTQPPAMRRHWFRTWETISDVSVLIPAVEAVALPAEVQLELEDLVSDPFFYRHVGGRVGGGGGGGGGYPGV